MHHIFDVDIAVKYGLNAAILLQNLQYWVAHNKANGKCYYEGRYWTYNSVKAFAELFPYLSEYQIRAALQRLIDDGVIVTGKFNRTSMDRTTWYSITEQGEAILSRKEETGTSAGQEDAGENPFGNYDDTGIPDTVETYAAQNLDRLSPGNMQEFAEYKKRLPDDVIRHAIDDACAHSARSWAYVRRILDAYIDKGYKTINEILAAEDGNARHRRDQQGRQPEDNPLLRAKWY